EDQRRVDAQLDAEVNVVGQPAGVAQQLPVDVVGLVQKDFDVENAVQRQVGHQHAKADGQQQQRLKLLDDGQVQQHAGHRQHDGVFPAALYQKNLRPAGFPQNLGQVGPKFAHVQPSLHK